MTTTHTTATATHFEAFAENTHERHTTNAEGTWVCGHAHRTEAAAEACAERSARTLTGHNNTAVNVWVRSC